MTGGRLRRDEKIQSIRRLALYRRATALIHLPARYQPPNAEIPVCARPRINA
jgi:hypothetical protein